MCSKFVGGIIESMRCTLETTYKLVFEPKNRRRMYYELPMLASINDWNNLTSDIVGNSLLQGRREGGFRGVQEPPCKV